MSQRRVVCICGSMRHFDAMLDASVDESLDGRIVVMPTVNTKQPDPRWNGGADAVKAALDGLHRDKIDMADEVLVVSPDGYIGESTLAEITYANRTDTPVRYTDPPEQESGLLCGSVLVTHPNGDYVIEQHRRHNRTVEDYMQEYVGKSPMGDSSVRCCGSALAWYNDFALHNGSRNELAEAIADELGEPDTRFGGVVVFTIPCSRSQLVSRIPQFTNTAMAAFIQVIGKRAGSPDRLRCEQPG